MNTISSTALIVGAEGGIGSALNELLLARYKAVYGTNRRSPHGENFFNIDLSNNFSDNKSNISNDSNFFEYIFFIIKKLFTKISNVENEIIIRIKNYVNTALSHNTIDLTYWNHVLSNESERCRLINLGTIEAKNFIDNLEKNNLKEARENLETAKTVEIETTTTKTTTETTRETTRESETETETTTTLESEETLDTNNILEPLI